MHIVLALLLLLQPVGTPIADSMLIVSEEGLQFPELPADIEPVAIDESWELLYYQVYAGSRDYLIRGEIRNISDNPLRTSTFVVELVDGTQIGIHPEIDRVEPGGRAPFTYSPYGNDEIAALNQAQELTFIEACDEPSIVPSQTTSWTFHDLNMDFNQSRNQLRLSGSVENTGQTVIEDHLPTVFVFDRDGYYSGKLIQLQFDEILSVGDVAEFEISQGFNRFQGDALKVGGKESQLVLAMAPVSIAYWSCIPL